MERDKSRSDCQEIAIAVSWRHFGIISLAQPLQSVSQLLYHRTLDTIWIMINLRTQISVLGLLLLLLTLDDGRYYLLLGSSKAWCTGKDKHERQERGRWVTMITLANYKFNQVVFLFRTYYNIDIKSPPRHHCMVHTQQPPPCH